MIFARFQATGEERCCRSRKLDCSSFHRERCQTKDQPVAYLIYPQLVFLLDGHLQHIEFILCRQNPIRGVPKISFMAKTEILEPLLLLLFVPLKYSDLLKRNLFKTHLVNFTSSRIDWPTFVFQLPLNDFLLQNTIDLQNTK